MTIQYVILAALWSGGASAACSFYLNANKKDIPWGGLLGAVSWVIFILVKNFWGSEAVGYFLGSLAVSVFSEILAFSMHNPATVYLLPGLLPLVPGAGIFLMMRSAILENPEAAIQRLFDVLVAAGAIALGVAISSSVFKLIHLARRKKHIKFQKEKELKENKEKAFFNEVLLKGNYNSNPDSPEEDGSF